MSAYPPSSNQLQLQCTGVDDIKYSIRSATSHADFFRNIYIVLSDYDELPSYFKKTAIKVVRHSDIVPNQYLPCFNSNVIESYIHKIKGLSEHFLYFNDDTYIGKTVSWKSFFTRSGMPINRHCQGPKNHSMMQHPFLYVQMMQNAIRKYGLQNTRYQIQVQPFKKSIIEMYETRFADEVKLHSKNKYRQADDFNLLRFTTCFSSTDKLAKILHTPFSVDYFTEASDKIKVQKIEKAIPTFFCINNNVKANTYVKDLLERLFPETSIVEKKKFAKK